MRRMQSAAYALLILTKRMDTPYMTNDILVCVWYSVPAVSASQPAHQHSLERIHAHTDVNHAHQHCHANLDWQGPYSIHLHGAHDGQADGPAAQPGGGRYHT